MWIITYNIKEQEYKAFFTQLVTAEMFLEMLDQSNLVDPDSIFLTEAKNDETQNR